MIDHKLLFIINLSRKSANDFASPCLYFACPGVSMGRAKSAKERKRVCGAGVVGVEKTCKFYRLLPPFFAFCWLLSLRCEEDFFASGEGSSPRCVAAGSVLVRFCPACGGGWRIADRRHFFSGCQAGRVRTRYARAPGFHPAKCL